MKKLIVAIVALLAVTAVIVVGFTGVLGVRHVEVVGVKGATASAVLAADGLVEGRPMAKLDTAAVAASVEGSVDGVRVVAVQRHWPSTVRIVVAPRVAVATVAEAGTARLVDGSGTEFGSAAVSTSLPTIVLAGTAATGQANKPAALKESLTVLTALPPKVRSRVQRVTYRSTDSITLTLEPGSVKVRWGSAERSARKALVLSALLKRSAEVYDVSSPDLPTTKGNAPTPRSTRG